MLILEKINVQRSSSRAHKKARRGENHWRSTVVAVVTDEAKSKVLLVTSDDSEFWGFPKGGIEYRDKFSPLRAVSRELNEELRIKHANVRTRRYLGSAFDLERTDQKRSERNPHVIGKHMHYVHVTIHERTRLRPNPAQHVSQAQWISSWAELKNLPMTRHRRHMMQLALQKIGLNWALETA